MAPAPRIVVADDSPFMRSVLEGALTTAGFEVVGSARDGDEALAQCRELRPDAMTLDLAMPGLDGIGVLSALRANDTPDLPVIVVSAFSPAHGARAVDALAEGAFDLVPKPEVGEPFRSFTDALAHRLRIAVIRHAATVADDGAARPAPAPPPARARSSTGGRRAVVIAASTGGPRALAQLMPELPAQVGDGVMIVQHMPAGFTGSLAARLDRGSRMHVREAVPGDAFAPGTALVAPGGSHLRLDGARRALLNEEPAIGGLRPRADLTIADVTEAWGERTLLVVLTGMGRDGAHGARAVREAGGRVICQTAETCTVYGMPRAVVEEGLADLTCGLDEMAHAIVVEAGA
jgi:two-component system, chemotaxis family, protein-glutamate methylesterase/glutaminase